MKFMLILLATLVVMAVIIFMASLFNNALAFAIIWGATIFVAAIALAKAFSSKRLVGIILAGALLLPTDVMAQEKPTAPTHENEERWVMIVVGAVVVVVGAVIVYKLYKLCDRVLPKSETKPPEPPKTTNSVSSTTHTLRTITINDPAMTMLDISDWASTNAAFRGPDGLPYTKLVKFMLLSGPTPRHLAVDCKVTGWISDTHMLTVMEGVSTNLSRIQPGELHFIGDNRNGRPDQAMRFYRTTEW